MQSRKKIIIKPKDKQKVASSSVTIVVDDRCDFFANGVRCPARRTTKQLYCVHHEAASKKPKVVPIMKDECPICLDQQEKFKWFSCGHGVCLGKDCFPKIRQLICPVCRADISFDVTRKERTRIEGNIRNAQNSFNIEGHAQARRLAQQLDAEEDDEVEGVEDGDEEDDDEDYEYEFSQFASGLTNVAHQPPAQPPPTILSVADLFQRVVGLVGRPALSIMIPSQNQPPRVQIPRQPQQNQPPYVQPITRADAMARMRGMYHYPGQSGFWTLNSG